MLNKMIAEREIEINNIIPPIPEKKERDNDKNNDKNNDNINIMLSDELNTNNKEIKPVKKLTNDFFKNLSKSNLNENVSNKVVSFNEDYNEEDEYEKDRYNSQIVYTNNNVMDLLKKMLNNQEVILTNQKKIMEKIFLTY